MKKVFYAVFAAVVVTLSACGGAHAADANLVKNTTGTATYGALEALGVDKDTSSGNRVWVKYPYGSGVQYIADDASWTKYNAMKAALVARGAMRVGATDKYLLVTVAVSTSCSNGISTVAFVGTTGAETVNDGCAFSDAVKANAF